MKIHFILFGIFLLTGCGTIKTEHNVHITMDINLRIEKELDDFFGDIDAESEEIVKSDKE